MRGGGGRPASRPQGIVHIVTAYEPGRESGADAELAGERQHAQALLDAVLLVGDDELLDTEYVTAVVAGSAASVIAGVARERGADEIVVGARGLGRIPALLGSVSHELLHIADRPVLVITDAAAKRASRWWPARRRGASGGQ